MNLKLNLVDIQYLEGLFMTKLTFILASLFLLQGLSFSQMNAVLVPQTNARYFTAEEVARVNSFPFTAIALDLSSGWAVFSPTVEEEYSFKVTEQWMRDEIALSLQTTITKDRYLRVYVDRWADLFDNWDVCIARWKMLANALRDNGYKGIFFDDEEYGGKIWNYPDDCKYREKSLDEYEAQARLRGRQIMDTVESAWPGLVMLQMHTAARSDPSVPDEVRANQFGYIELAGAFFAGMLEAKDSTTTLYDGGELYNYRTVADFETSYQYRKHNLGNVRFNSPLSTSKWEQVQVSFAQYNIPWQGNAMDADIMRSSYENALYRADNHFAWMWVEEADWIANGIPLDWDVSIKGAIGTIPASDSILAIEAPDYVAQGSTPTIKVSYDASEERDIVVLYTLDEDPFTSYGSDTITVKAGTDFVYIDVPTGSNAPLATDAYRFLVYLTPHGGGYDERLAELARENVDCIPGGAETDALTSLEAPGQFTPGSIQMIRVGYSATMDRDIMIRFMQNKSPYFVYGTAKYMVPRGSVWTVDIAVPVAENAPLGLDAYNIIVRILPLGGTWNDRFGELVERNVDCVDTILTNLPGLSLGNPNLQQNYPNPFNISTCIEYNTPEAGHVLIDIFDMQGRIVKRLEDQNHIAGEYSVLWDACNEQGIKMPEGIYLYRFSFTGKNRTFSHVSKMQLIK
jgi:hypothetical protein